MHPIFILEHVRISSPEKLTISIMEGISSMVESIPSSSSIDTIINHIDEHSYEELYNYIKMIFNESITKGTEEAMRFLDQMAINLWKTYKLTLDSLNALIDQMSDAAIIEDANLKKSIKSMFSIGLDDHDIIEAIVNGNVDSMKSIVSSIGIDKTADYIEMSIRSEKSNVLLHRVKDTFLPMMKNNLTPV